MSPKSSKADLECICPKCGVSHILKLFWTGKGKPKKFCRECKGLSDLIGDQPILKATKLKQATEIYLP